MFKLSMRDLRAHLGRYILTFIAVAIGVAFVGGVSTLTDTISRSFDDLFADVTAGTDAWVQGEAAFDIGAQFGGGTQRPHIDESLVEQIAQVDGVAEAEAFAQGFARVIDKDGEPVGNPDFGPPTFGASWGEVEDLNPFDLVEGSQAPSGPDEIVLDKATADSTGYEIGDTAGFQTLAGPGEATVVGIATFGTADSPLGASFVFFDLATAERLLGEPGEVNGIGIVAEAGVPQTEVRDLVADELEADNVEVLTGEEYTTQNQDDSAESFEFFRILLLVFALISVAVGAFVIYTSFSFIVAQRQRQVALLRAVGAGRRQVLGSILLESLIVGIVASAAGYLLGVGLALLLSSFIVDDGASLVILPGSVLTAMLVGTVVTVLSAFVPSWRATRIPPVAALRHIAIDKSHRSLPRLILSLLAGGLGVFLLVSGLGGAGIEAAGGGMALVFLALVIFGPLAAKPTAVTIGTPLPRVRGIVGRLAQQNAARNPKRTASTASALMIGMGIVTLFLVMNSSVRASIDDVVDNRFAGDYVIADSSGFMSPGLPPAATADINALDEVDAATGVRFAFAEIDGKAEPLGGADPQRAFDLFDVGVTGGDVADLDEDGIAVYDQRAEDEGWEVGDTLPVNFVETGATDLTIVALMETQDLLGPFVVGNEAFDANVPTSGDVQIWIRLADGVEVEDARPALTGIVEQYPTAELQDLDEFKSATKEQFLPILILINVLLALTILIAMIGIVNTLILSVIERTQEIGLTRAVGATRGQIRSTIRWEAVLIALFGLVAALGVGVFFGWVIVQALADLGFTAFEIPIAELVIVTIVTALLTLGAAVFPAAWAGRRPILSAIATE